MHQSFSSTLYFGLLRFIVAATYSDNSLIFVLHKKNNGSYAKHYCFLNYRCIYCLLLNFNIPKSNSNKRFVSLIKEPKNFCSKIKNSIDLKSLITWQKLWIYFYNKHYIRLESNISFQWRLWISTRKSVANNESVLKSSLSERGDQSTGNKFWVKIRNMAGAWTTCKQKQ